MFNRSMLSAVVLAKQLYRSVTFQIATMAILAGSFFLFSLFRPDSDYIGMLQFSHFSVIALMLLFLLFGAKIGGMEFDYHCNELLRAYPNSSEAMALGQLHIGLALPMLFSVAILLEVLILYATMGIKASLCAYAGRYILLYYFFPCSSSMMLGMGIGAVVRSRWKYALLMLIFLFISPISPEVFAYVFEALNTRSERLHYFFMMLSLSRTRSLEISPLYGHSQEYARLLVALLRLTIITVFALTIRISSSKKTRIAVAALTLCAVFFAIQTTNTEQNRILFLYGNAQDLSSYVYDVDYYLEMNRGGAEYPDASPEKHFTRRSVDVSLDTHLTGMSVVCNMDLVCIQTTQRQAFTLYRNFCVQSVRMEGAPIPFEQDGDYVTVDFGRVVNAEEVIKLEFMYSGASSPSFPANSNYVRLVGSFPWIPDVGAALPLIESSYGDVLTYTLSSANQDETPVEYTLHFPKASDLIFTNLLSISKTTWKGRSERGIILIMDPMLMRDMINGVDFYYPATIDGKKQIVVEHMKRYIAARETVLELLGAPLGSPMERLILTPVPLWMSDSASDVGADYGHGVYALYSESIYSVASYSDQEIWGKDGGFAIDISMFFALQPEFQAMMDNQREYRLFLAAFTDQLKQFFSDRVSERENNAYFLDIEMDMIINWDDSPETIARIHEIHRLLSRLVNETNLNDNVKLWKMWYKQNMTSEGDIDILIDAVKVVLGDEQP